jgi:error-prone DNA polymerase
MRDNGYSDEFARNVFTQIQGFGSYGFPESHSASFALLVYVSAWIKRHHPEVFLAALINSQPMGFYAPAQLVADARRHGVDIRPVDINFSTWDARLERTAQGTWSVRLGWSQVRGMQLSIAEILVQERERGEFTSYSEFVRRTQFTAAVLSHLASADAFGSIGMGRRPALWQALARGEASPLYDQLPDDDVSPLPPLSEPQEIVQDYQATGLSLRGHPFARLRQQLTKTGVVTTAALATLEPDRRYRVAGLVLLRQRPGTAKGITFMTLEDETGVTNLIVRPEVWERFRQVARGAGAMIASGRLQRQEGVIHLLVDQMQDLTETMRKVRHASRDFR